MSKFVLGVDLASLSDNTAVVVVERLTEKTGEFEDVWDRQSKQFARVEKTLDKYAVRHIDVWASSEYPDTAKKVKRIVEQLPKDTDVVIDATGVGVPFVQQLRREGLPSCIAITITGGDAETPGKMGLNVPKKLLIARLMYYFHNQRLLAAKGLKYWDQARTELLGFSAKKFGSRTVLGNDNRLSDHDDIVLSLALAIFWADRTSKSKEKTPSRKHDEMKWEEHRMLKWAIDAQKKASRRRDD